MPHAFPFNQNHAILAFVGDKDEEKQAIVAGAKYTAGLDQIKKIRVLYTNLFLLLIVELYRSCLYICYVAYIFISIYHQTGKLNISQYDFIAVSNAVFPDIISLRSLLKDRFPKPQKGRYTDKMQ